MKYWMNYSSYALSVLLILGIGFIFASPADAQSLKLTISGTYGPVIDLGVGTAAFDNGNTFSVSVTLPSSTPTPTFSEPGRSWITTSGLSYTNGGATVGTGPQTLILDEPDSWNEDLHIIANSVYIPGDFLEMIFNGPLLFSGSTSAPVIGTGNYSLNMSSNTFNRFAVRYSNKGPTVCCSDAPLVGNATLKISLVIPRDDFNGDGKSDIVWQHPNGSTSIGLMNGLNGNGSAVLIGAGTGWSIKRRGDFNGDGKNDIVWQNTDGSTSVWLMNGLSVIGGGGLLGPGSPWRVVQVGDFNGDGKSDIVWQNTDGSAAIWLMNGLSVLGGSGLIGPGTGWSVVQVGDFNGDGKSDIVWQNTDGSAAIWLMNGLSVLGGSGLIGPGTGWSVKQVGDFNGDGKSDVVWQNTDGSAAIWLMNGLSVLSGGGLIGPGTVWTVKEIGDFNGDGKSDIIWQGTDGSTAMWLMNGLNGTAGAILPGPGTAWSVVP